MPFLEELYKHNYTDLLIQYGQHGDPIFQHFMDNYGSNVKEKYGIYVTGFDFNYEGLREEMIAVKGNPSYRRDEGVVLSHSGKCAINLNMSMYPTKLSKARGLSLRFCDLTSLLLSSQIPTS